MATPPPPRRPGGARPNPSTLTAQALNHPCPLPIATITSPAIGDPKSVDEGMSPVPRLAARNDGTPSKIIEPPRPSGSPYPQATPSLALKSRLTPSLSSIKPKLSLSSPFPSPALPTSATASPSPLGNGGTSYNPSPTSFSSSRPPLLNAPAASDAHISRRATPALKISMPAGPSSSALSTSSSPGYPHASCHMDAEADALNSALKTPTVGEDQNLTIRAGAYEDGESAYGYGRLNNGLRPEGDSEYSAMTAALKKAVSKSRFDGSPNPSSRSRASSVAGSHGSRRGSHTEEVVEDLSVQHLNTSFDSLGLGDRRRGSDGSEAGSEAAQPFDPSELKWVRRLGEGTGGSVDLVREERTGRIMAKKVIASTPDPALHKQILRELKFLDECSCPYIVEHYGSFLNERESEVGILMEYCEGGSLDGLIHKMKKNGMRCSEHVLGRIASSVLRGLDYLHNRHIVHRDIKPSNIVLTRDGAVKLCDFGVSGETINSIAGTFTGTSYYMAPERIQGQEYTIKADVWSLGVTLHEVAHLRFPFASDDDSRLLAPIELVTHIVNADIPEMKDDPSVGRTWSEPIKDFMRQCLTRDRNLRPYPWQLLAHPFITASDSKKVNMGKWVATLLGWPIE